MMALLRRTRRTAGALGLCALMACSSSGGSRTLVASFYPLAFAADRIGGPGWRVVDLTPPGTEAHDVELSLEDRAALEEADVVLYLGDIGFQPQVERAVGEATGRVVAVADGLHLVEGGGEEDGPQLDPHVWLDPVSFATVVDRTADALAAADPGNAETYRGRARALRDELEALDRRYAEGLSSCRSSIMVTSHEAFGYLAARYGLQQVGLTGLTPEGEPTAGRLGRAGQLLADGQALALFFEASDEARRIAESVASDYDVPALPLGTLESQPTNGDYLSVMETNLTSLKRGLGCG
jgi:zinc transport system substrate-binding protein